MAAMKSLPDSELTVLKALWDSRSATIRDLAAVVYGEATPSTHATVQKLLERLEAKGHVERDTSERAHRFRSSVSRAGLVGLRLQETADRLCDGRLSPLLTHLVEEAELTEDDIERLRALIRQREEGGED
jgi:predicted transcriptional regulator